MWRAEVLVERGFALRGFGHHVDAAAGRVHLLAPEDVGGAGGEAEAAVDAVGEELFFGRVVRVEGAGFRGLDLGEHGWQWSDPLPLIGQSLRMGLGASN